jgi:hypothetical protein
MGSSHLERFSLGALGHPMHLARRPNGPPMSSAREPEGHQLKKLLATLVMGCSLMAGFRLVNGYEDLSRPYTELICGSYYTRVRGYRKYCCCEEFDIDRGRERPRSISAFRGATNFPIFSIPSVVTNKFRASRSIGIESNVAEDSNINDRPVNICDTVRKCRHRTASIPKIIQ